MIKKPFFFNTYPNVLLHIKELIGFIQVKAIPDTGNRMSKDTAVKNNMMCLRNLGTGGLLLLDWKVGSTDLILLNLESSLLEAWIFISRQWVGDGEGRWVLGCFEDF